MNLIYQRILQFGFLILLCARVGLNLAHAVEEDLSWSEPFPTQDSALINAQNAWRQGDGELVARMKQEALQKAHPLAAWFDYWDMNLRLAKLRSSDLEEFYARWPGTYVEDRLRNDWLLELGRRRDWVAIQEEFPRFRMNDDKQVTCYWHLAQHHHGLEVGRIALGAWLEQSEADDACYLMAQTLIEKGQFKEGDIWQKILSEAAASRYKSVDQVLSLLPKNMRLVLKPGLENPLTVLSNKIKVAKLDRTHQSYIYALLLVRYAQQDLGGAQKLIQLQSKDFISYQAQAWLWAQMGRQAAIKALPRAEEYFQKAWQLADGIQRSPFVWTHETLAWAVRVALRSSHALKNRWILQAIQQMSSKDQLEPVWSYWRARALLETAHADIHAEAQRKEARKLLGTIASPFHFYGKLALEELGQAIRFPPKPAPPSLSEKLATKSHLGLNRSLRLIALNLRTEGVREWNFSVRGMTDRQLLAAAQWACDRQIWDRCINTSERTKESIDIDQRYPTPFRADILAHAKEVELDPAYVFGLIRQESRFITLAQSHVGAAGLMQVMPATARWVAKKLGLAFEPFMLQEKNTNLRLGTRYLKWVLDDLGGSQVMAAAAYNAGPGRPRRWREWGAVESAAWAESIPFTETRDYVKKVLSNAVVYSAQLGDNNLSLRARLGPVIAPRGSQEQAVNTSLP